MLTDEITPVQRRLLDTISPREAEDIYKDLSTTHIYGDMLLHRRIRRSGTQPSDGVGYDIVAEGD